LGLTLGNDTYYLTPKCQIMNQETKLIKTKLGLLNLAEHLNYVTPLFFPDESPPEFENISQ